MAGKDEAMDVLRHDLFYWQLVHYLVINGEMRVMEVSPNKTEIWLEHENSKENEIVRIVRRDIDWTNQVRADLEELSKKSEGLRRQLGLSRLTIKNVYISIFPPVDDWGQFGRITYAGRKNQTKIVTHLIEQQDMEQQYLEMMRLINDLSVSPPPLYEWKEVEIENLEGIKEKVLNEANERLEREKKLFSFGKPLVTYALLIVVSTIFALLEINGGSTSILTLIEFGAKYNPFIEEGQWWRLFSAMFLHIGFLHFFMNSLALFYIGSMVERMYGSRRFLVLYIIAGLFGSIASYAFNDQVSAGASGAIFGCFGALLYFGLIHKKLFFRTIGMSVVVILAINLSFGFIVPIIDNGAHIGGLVGGFLASSFLHLPKHPGMKRQAAMLVFTVITFFALLSFGQWNEAKGGSPLVHLQFAQELLQDEQIERAYPILQELVAENMEMPEAYFLLAYAEAHLEIYDAARENFKKAIELRYTFHEAHYNVALIYAEQQQYDEALNYVNAAIELAPGEDTYYSLKERIERERR